MSSLKSVLFFWAIILLTLEGQAQCCSPGNPLGGYGNNGTLTKNTFKLYSQYKYSYSGRYKQGDQPYEGDTKSFQRSVKDANYNFLGLGAAWGISERLTLEVETGYFINKTQYHQEGILPESQKGSGFTDLSFLVKPALYKTGSLEFSPAFGMKLPLGKYNQQYQGSVLPPDLQPSTGAVNYIAGFFLYKEYLKKHLRFFMIGRYEFPRANAVGIQYGNTFLHSVFVSYSASTRLTFTLQLRDEFRKQDRNGYSATSYYSSGSHKLFVVPQVTYALTPLWDISVFSDIPVYQFYNGYQLGNTIAAAMMVSAKIDRRKPTLPSPEK